MSGHRHSAFSSVWEPAPRFDQLVFGGTPDHSHNHGREAWVRKPGKKQTHEQDLRDEEAFRRRWEKGVSPRRRPNPPVPVRDPTRPGRRRGPEYVNAQHPRNVRYPSRPPLHEPGPNQRQPLPPLNQLGDLPRQLGHPPEPRIPPVLPVWQPGPHPWQPPGVLPQRMDHARDPLIPRVQEPRPQPRRPQPPVNLPHGLFQQPRHPHNPPIQPVPPAPAAQQPAPNMRQPRDPRNAQIQPVLPVQAAQQPAPDPRQPSPPLNMPGAYPQDPLPPQRPILRQPQPQHQQPRPGNGPRGEGEDRARDEGGGGRRGLGRYNLRRRPPQDGNRNDQDDNSAAGDSEDPLQLFDVSSDSSENGDPHHRVDAYYAPYSLMGPKIDHSSESSTRRQTRTSSLHGGDQTAHSTQRSYSPISLADYILEDDEVDIGSLSVENEAVIDCEDSSFDEDDLQERVRSESNGPCQSKNSGPKRGHRSTIRDRERRNITLKLHSRRTYSHARKKSPRCLSRESQYLQPPCARQSRSCLRPDPHEASKVQLRLRGGAGSQEDSKAEDQDPLELFDVESSDDGRPEQHRRDVERRHPRDLERYPTSHPERHHLREPEPYHRRDAERQVPLQRPQQGAAGTAAERQPRQPADDRQPEGSGQMGREVPTDSRYRDHDVVIDGENYTVRAHRYMTRGQVQRIASDDLAYHRKKKAKAEQRRRAEERREARGETATTITCVLM